MILGIDPGVTGAVALYYPGGVTETLVFDMPLDVDGRVDAQRVAAWLWTRNVTRAFVEQVSSMPRQAGAFNFGMSAGIVHGVLGALGIPVTLVPPSKWKAAMGLKRLEGQTKGDSKTLARRLAQQLFPAIADQFKRAKDDGRAEALLIAVYGANAK